MPPELRRAATEIALKNPLHFLRRGAGRMGEDPVGIPAKLNRSLVDIASDNLGFVEAAEFVLELGEIDHQDAGNNHLKQQVVRGGGEAKGLWSTHSLKGFNPHRLLAGWGKNGSVIGLYQTPSRRVQFRRESDVAIEVGGVDRKTGTDQILLSAALRLGKPHSWGNGDFQLAAPVIYGYRITRRDEIAEVVFQRAVRR